MCVQRLIHQADTNAIFDLIAALSRRLLAALAAPAQLHHVFAALCGLLRLNFISLFLEDFLLPLNGASVLPAHQEERGALFDWQVNEGRCS